MGTNDDIKARMQAALDRKNQKEQGVHTDAQGKEKAHGPESHGKTPKLHRRRAG